MSQGVKSTHCLNCGAPLQGPFCSRCGQKDQERNLPLKHVLEEVLHDILHFDLRFLDTLRILLCHPGQLTEEYMAGRRARHIPPFRLYVFISFVLFLILGLGGAKATGHRERRSQKHGVVVTVGEGAGEAPAGEEPQGQGLEAEPESGKKKGVFARGIRHAAEDPQAFKTHLLHGISRAMFLLLPAFAALLKLLYLRTGKYFVEHVIFSLHWHAFVFTVFIALWALSWLPGCWSALPQAALLVWIPINLGAAMKRVYGQSTLRILVKGALVTAAYAVTVCLVLGGVTLWVIAHGGNA